MKDVGDKDEPLRRLSVVRCMFIVSVSLLSILNWISFSFSSWQSFIIVDFAMCCFLMVFSRSPVVDWLFCVIGVETCSVGPLFMFNSL